MSETRKFVDHIRELEFITAIFTWIFNFLSRVAEPLMTLAVIYTIIVAGIPHAYQPVVYNIAVAAMIGSPEIILPGALILAEQEQRSGNKQAWMLLVVCGLFVLLTALTLSDLFIFHFGSQGVSILMCARCVTGVSYSIIVRIVNQQEGSEMSGSRTLFNPQQFTDQILGQVNQMNQQLVHGLNNSQQEFMNQVLSRVDQMNQYVMRNLNSSQQATEESVNLATVQIEQASVLRIGQLATSIEGLKQHRQHSQLPSCTLSQTERTCQGSGTLPHVECEIVSAPDRCPEQTTEGVHEQSHLSPIQKKERINREQVCTFIMNYWREEGNRPTIQLVRDRTGCSQGLASTCCNLVAQQIGA